MKLPIRRVPNTSPPTFEWDQLVLSPTASEDDRARKIRHTGAVQASMERPLCELVELAERLSKENEELRAQVSSYQERKAKKV